MLKLTKTGIGLLTKQYKSVLRKCLLLNLGLFLINSILLSKSLANVGLLFNASLTDYGNGKIFMSNGGPNSPSGTTGLYLADEIHYLPLSKFGFSTIGGFLYASDGSSVMNVSAFNFASVTVLDSLVNQLDRAIGNNINSNGKYIKASNINSVTDNLIALDDALNYYYTKDEIDTNLGIKKISTINPAQGAYHVYDSSSGLKETSYKNTNILGGNFIKAYYNVSTNASYNPYFTFTYADGTDGARHYRYLNLANLADENEWSEDANGNWYNTILGEKAVTEATKQEIISRLKQGKLLNNYYQSGTNLSVERSDYSLADNIAILDEVVGTWDDGNYVKKFDALEYRGDANTGYKSTTIGANLKALDAAIGSWNGGHYIKNSVSSSNPADTTHLTVGQALSALDEQLYNYYYTFRVDKRAEVTEFTKELKTYFFLVIICLNKNLFLIHS